MMIILASLLLLFFTASVAHGECAWVLWELAEHHDPRGGGLATAGWKAKDAYEARRECDAVLTRTASFLLNYARENNYKAERLGNRITHWDGGTLAAVYTVQCLPDTVDPRGSKAK